MESSYSPENLKIIKRNSRKVNNLNLEDIQHGMRGLIFEGYLIDNKELLSIFFTIEHDTLSETVNAWLDKSFLRIRDEIPFDCNKLLVHGDCDREISILYPSTPKDISNMIGSLSIQLKKIVLKNKKNDGIMIGNKIYSLYSEHLFDINVRVQGYIQSMLIVEYYTQEKFPFSNEIKKKFQMLSDRYNYKNFLDYEEYYPEHAFSPFKNTLKSDK